MLKEGQRLQVETLGKVRLVVIWNGKHPKNSSAQAVEVKRIPRRLKAEDGSLRKYLLKEFSSNKALFLRRVPSRKFLAFDVYSRKV